MMPIRPTKSTRNRRIADAISELAALYEYGELLAATEPDELLRLAADEIRTARKVAMGTSAEVRTTDPELAALALADNLSWRAP